MLVSVVCGVRACGFAFVCCLVCACGCVCVESDLGVHMLFVCVCVCYVWVFAPALLCCAIVCVFA